MKKGSLFKILIALVLLSGLVAAAILVRKQQETRRGAAGERAVFILDPLEIGNMKGKAGQNFDVKLLTTYNQKISALDITIPFSRRYLEVVDVKLLPGGVFNRWGIKEIKNDKGYIRLVMTQTGDLKKAGGVVDIKFKLKKELAEDRVEVISSSGWKIEAVGPGTSNPAIYTPASPASLTLYKEEIREGGPTNTPRATGSPGQPSPTATPTLAANVCLEPRGNNCYSDKDNCKTNCGHECTLDPKDAQGNNLCSWSPAYLCCAQPTATPKASSTPIPNTPTPSPTPIPGAPQSPENLRAYNDSGEARRLSNGTLCTTDNTPLWRWQKRSDDSVAVTKTKIKRSWLDESLQVFDGLVKVWQAVGDDHLPNNPDKKYCLQAAFGNDKGWSNWSGPACVRVDKRGPRPPTPRFTEATTSVIKVEWDRPDDIGCAGIATRSAYRYQIARKPGFGDIIAQGWQSITHSWARVAGSDLGISNNDTVYVRVKTRDKLGNLSDWSPVVSQRIGAVISPPPSQPSPSVAPTLPPGECNCQQGGEYKARGDANCDGQVDVLDFEAWFDTFVRGSNGYGLTADLNCDGQVTIDDYQVWLDGNPLYQE